MSNIVFTPEFNALSVKHQYFILKHTLRTDDKHALINPDNAAILDSEECQHWVRDNRLAIIQNCNEWNVQYNSFKP